MPSLTFVSHLRFGALWLLVSPFSTFISLVDAACEKCWGAAYGCTGSTAHCPWVAGIAANAAVVVAATGGSIVVSKILPPKLSNILPKRVLDLLSSVVSRVQNGTSFDPDGKTPAEIVKAVRLSHCAPDDAILALTEKISEIADDADDVSNKIKKLESAIKSVETLSHKGHSVATNSEGAMLYLLARISRFICTTRKGAVSFDLCGECSPSSSDSTSSVSFSASMTRPHSIEQLTSLLNLWSLACIATGVTNAVGLHIFMEDVIFEPIRSQSCAWPVAFECMILYLRLVESGTSYVLATVKEKSGGMDSIREEATAIARDHYPAAFFRIFGGNPRDEIIPGGGKKGDVFKGTLKGDTPTSTRGCVAWNMGSPHLAKHVGPDGKCLFKHGICDQFVTDKGKGGQCGSTQHKRPECDYDSAKKCSKPLP